MNELNDFIDYLSSILEMDAIPLEILSREEMNNISEEKTLAAYDREKKVIYIVEQVDYTIMDYYLISHEVRHAWQDIDNPGYYFGDYLNDWSEHEYNTSEAEIDANAFACIAIAIAFNKVTSRSYLSDEDAQKKYTKRLNELKKQFEIDF